MTLFRTALFVLLALCMLSACSLSAKKVAEVDRRVDDSQQRALTCDAGIGDRCAIDSPLYQRGTQNVIDGRHDVTLIEHGEDALRIRIHLIRAARERIELQNFILRKDETGELILNELLTAARRGIKVRLLLDQMFSFSDVEYLVLLAMTHSNFEIRFYNPSFYKAKMAKHDWISAVACCFRRFNQRMHNKLLTVDDVVSVIGGRNIADRYFDFDTNYNFKDRDVVVFGPASLEIRQSFDWFWQSPKTIPVQHLRDVASELLSNEPAQLPAYEMSERLARLLEHVESPVMMETIFLEPTYAVERLEYFSDRPRKEAFPDDAPKKDMTGELYEVLTSAQQSVVIQSPYMVLSRRARNLFIELRQRNPDIELIFSTNSLASTDADTVYANTHKHKVRYVKKLGFQMYEFRPYPLDAPSIFPRLPDLIEEKKQGVNSKSVVSGDNSTMPMPAPRTGLHSKSFVVDGKIAMIGSHNFDPRSEGFNTENGLIVWDEAFAQDVEQLIRRDIEAQNSWVVAMRPNEEQEKSAIGPLPKTITEFKPWSYSSTSVYELAPGKEAVTPDSPDFYKNYYDVGSFPEVIRTRRQVTIIFLGSLFGFLEPVL